MKGEAPATWPIEFFYERVWTRPFTERRTMQLGAERVARAKLSADHTSLEDVDVLAEGVERRIVVAREGKPEAVLTRSDLLEYLAHRR